MTPAQGYQKMMDDLLENVRVEGTLRAGARTLADIPGPHLTEEERSSLAVAREALDEVVRSVHARHQARVQAVLAAEHKALTRYCKGGSHYWLDEVGRRPTATPPAADPYEFATARLCPAHSNLEHGRY